MLICCVAMGLLFAVDRQTRSREKAAPNIRKPRKASKAKNTIKPTVDNDDAVADAELEEVAQ